MNRFKRLAFWFLWLLLPALLLYSSYICVGGYPEQWDRILPGMSVDEAVEICGPPGERSEKCDLLWREAHLLGRYELRAWTNGQGTVKELQLVVDFLKGRPTIRYYMFSKWCKECP